MHLTGQLAQHHAHVLEHGRLARVDLPVLVMLAHGGPLSSRCSWRFARVPTARQDSGGGTATSTSTRSGTTSAVSFQVSVPG